MPPRPVSGGGRAMLVRSEEDNTDSILFDEALSAADISLLHFNDDIPFSENWYPPHSGAATAEADLGGSRELVHRQNGNGTGNGNGNNNNRFCGSCVIQDNDPRIAYTGKWLLNGTSFQTTHSTTASGAKAVFFFKGSRIVVFGTVPTSNSTRKAPTARYTVDKRRPVVSTVPMANAPIANQPFFRADGLDGELHKLTIEVTQVGAPYILQHLFVLPSFNRTNVGNTTDRGGGNSTTIATPEEPRETSTEGAVSESASPSPSATTISPGAEATVTLDGGDERSWESGTATDSDASQQPSGPSARTLGVLSVVLGILIILILGGILVFIVRRRKQKRRRPFSSNKPFWRTWRNNEADIVRPDTAYTSFTLPSSIQRNEPSFFMRGSSAFSRSDGVPSDLRTSAIVPNVPPFPPDAGLPEKPGAPF